MSSKKDIGWIRFKQIFLFSDSEPNEVLIGLLHAVILPFAMFEMGDPSLMFQVLASATGWFQLYSVLYNGKLKIRKIAVQLATLVAIATCINYYMMDMLKGSHFGWLLILIFAIWNLIRVTREGFLKG
jgi:hypothetical protein